MMTPTDRLRAAIHLESAAIAPQTSPLIEAAKEVLAENGRLLATLGEIETVSNIAPADDRYGSLAVRMGKVWLLSRGHALHQQTIQQKE